MTIPIKDITQGNRFQINELGDKMNTTIQSGQVTYIGFDSNNNNKWIIETKGNYTYVIYQEDEFTQVIFGYVIKQNNGKYKSCHGLDENSSKYFETVDDGIKYVKSFKKETEG